MSQRIWDDAARYHSKDFLKGPGVHTKQEGSGSGKNNKK